MWNVGQCYQFFCRKSIFPPKQKKKSKFENSARISFSCRSWHWKKLVGDLDLAVKCFYHWLQLGYGKSVKPSKALHQGHCCSESVWPDLAIYLPKSPTFLDNFCKGVKIYNFSSEIIFGQLFRHLAIFFWSHCLESPRVQSLGAGKHLPSTTMTLIKICLILSIDLCY